MKLARNRPLHKIEGYGYKDYRGRWHHKSLVTHHEYWSIWIYKDGQLKLKITQWRNIQSDGLPLHIGTMDSYDWICIDLWEQVSCLRLVNAKHIKLSDRLTPNDYKMYLKKTSCKR